MNYIVKQSVKDGTRSIDMRIAYFRKIVKIGNSNCVIVPRDVRIMIGAKEGDWVRIEIGKVEISEPNLHDNSTAQQDPKARMEGTDKES